jgi:hypothetical protein
LHETALCRATDCRIRRLQQFDQASAIVKDVQNRCHCGDVVGPSRVAATEVLQFLREQDCIGYLL